MARAPAARRVALFVAAAALLAAAVSGPVAPAGADGPNHAAVIVETGAAVHRVVVSFDADSISGVEALALVPGADPSVVGFSGIGAAVCGLFGVGHPATVQECLGVPGDQRSWSYWHVPAGQSGFDDSTLSRAGAGSVRVHDGDTEGWLFGIAGEAAPTFVQLSVPEPPAATAPPAAPGPPVPGPAAPPSAAGAPAPGPTASGGRATTTSTLAATTGGSVAPGAASRDSTTSTSRSRAEVEASRASATGRTDEDDSDGGSVASIAGFLAVLVVLGAGILFARRARVGSRPPGP